MKYMRALLSAYLYCWHVIAHPLNCQTREELQDHKSSRFLKTLSYILDQEIGIDHFKVMTLWWITFTATQTPVWKNRDNTHHVSMAELKVQNTGILKCQQRSRGREPELNHKIFWMNVNFIRGATTNVAIHSFIHLTSWSLNKLCHMLWRS